MARALLRLAQGPRSEGLPPRASATPVTRATRLFAAAALLVLPGSALTVAAVAQTNSGISAQDLSAPANTDPSRVLGSGGAAAPSAPKPPAPPAIPEPPDGTAAAGSGTASPPDWTPKSTADLIILDKIYGTTNRVTVPLGKPFTVRTLQITVLACYVRPPNVPPDAAVFLQVVDHRPDPPPPFYGWLLRAEPGLSGLADPVTDIAVGECS
jgi:hypothetical protein